MKNKLIAIAATLILGGVLSAEEIEGTWMSIDDETGKILHQNYR